MIRNIEYLRGLRRKYRSQARERFEIDKESEIIQRLRLKISIDWSSELEILVNLKFGLWVIPKVSRISKSALESIKGHAIVNI